MNNENWEKGALYRFKPGQSGNPGGRPRKRPISDRYAEVAEFELPEKERIKRGLTEGATYGDALAMARFKDALDGKSDAAREIREAIEGKTGKHQEDTGQKQITFEIVNIGQPRSPATAEPPLDPSVSRGSSE